MVQLSATIQASPTQGTFLEVLARPLTATMNVSLYPGNVSDQSKVVAIRTLLREPSLGLQELSNYRPTSNVPFLSKVLEKIVTAQLLQSYF